MSIHKQSKISNTCSGAREYTSALHEWTNEPKWMPPPTGFSNFSQECEELLLRTKFLTVGSSLGHLSMKNFSDRTYRLGPKIRQREGAGGWQPPPPPIEQKLTYFSNHEDDIQSEQILV